MKINWEYDPWILLAVATALVCITILMADVLLKARQISDLESEAIKRGHAEYRVVNKQIEFHWKQGP